MPLNLQELRYPIGRFQAPTDIDEGQIQAWIRDIEALPGDLQRQVEWLSESRLNTQYRPEGWAIRQVVHHILDSHMDQLHPVRVGTDGGLPGNQGLFRGALGGTGGLPRSACGGIPGLAGVVASALGRPTAIAGIGRSEAGVCSFRDRIGYRSG